MAQTVQPKVKIETLVSASLHKKFKAKAKKMNTSMSDLVRDWMQKFTK